MVIIGNEACDLDSAVSAIVYGFYLIQSATNERLITPVLNIKKEDYVLKTEVVYLFNKCGISKDHLIFRDDLDLKVGVFHIVKWFNEMNGNYGKLNPHLFDDRFEAVVELISRNVGYLIFKEDKYGQVHQCQCQTVSSSMPNLAAQAIQQTHLQDCQFTQYWIVCWLRSFFIQIGNIF